MLDHSPDKVDIQLGTGSGSFDYMPSVRDRLSQMRVYYHKPENFGWHSPVVFVIHGNKRNAERYRDNWKELSESQSLLVVVPEFSEGNFPGVESFNLGNMFRPDGQPIDSDSWSFKHLEGIFKSMGNDPDIPQQNYYVFGHAAGAQFVQRLVMFSESPGLETAIIANAGWYTMPTLSFDFPYGLEGTDTTSEMLERAFGKKLVIAVGENDTDPLHRSLRRTLKQTIRD